MNIYHRIVIACALILCTGTFYPTQTESLRNKISARFSRSEMSSDEKAKKLLDQIKNDLQALRSIVADALENNVVNTSHLNDTVNRLNKAAKESSVLELLSDDVRVLLKPQAAVLLQIYQALQEDAAVLDLWTRGYEGYEKDLDDNFQKLLLPHAAIKKPDNKKLYEELGLKVELGRNASFNRIQNKYHQKFNDLQEKAKKTKEDFDSTYFRPYLRVLDYIFRTPYGKIQYDIYLEGPAAYTKKTSTLKKYEKIIQKLFTQDIPQLSFLTGTIRSEFGIQ